MKRHFLLVAFFATGFARAADQPNILFIAIDDQNDWIGGLGGHPQVKTPHLDGLAARGTLFTNAHYADGSEELYDMRADPDEWKNLAADAQLADVKRDLAKWLPRVNQQPVPGSESRILLYNAATGAVNWEGQAVGANDPIPDRPHQFNAVKRPFFSSRFSLLRPTRPTNPCRSARRRSGPSERCYITRSGELTP
jgi:hypothetical protein